MRIVYEQEECIEEEMCDRSLPKVYRAEESVHINGIKLETPEINAVEISELPREVKLEMPIEQSESKLVWDMILVSDIVTPLWCNIMYIILVNGNCVIDIGLNLMRW